MDRVKVCPKCGGEMEVGFMPALILPAYPRMIVQTLQGPPHPAIVLVDVGPFTVTHFEHHRVSPKPI
jgi:hypothetical protein